MAFSPNVWNQLKNLTADDLIEALERDGWSREPSKGAILVFLKVGNPNKRLAIHYHPRKTFGAKLLKALLEDTGWTEDDLRLLGLIR